MQREHFVARLPKTEVPVRLLRLAGATNPLPRSTKPSPAVKVRYAKIPRHRLDRHRHCTIRSAVGGEAQSNTKPVIAPPSRTINLTAEQSFIVKEIVLKDLNVSKAQAGAPESIGVPVPPSVELHDMTPALAENVPQAKSHA